MQKIQVGFLVSYDYNLLKNAIPCVYNEADTIFLAIDKDRKTWTGKPFSISEEFFNWVKKIDGKQKIVIYEDSFYVEGFTTMQCEIRERKMLAEKMGIGNWIIQLDADEYFIHFVRFVNRLKEYNYFLRNPEKNKIQIFAYSLNIYKKVETGFLYVNKPTKGVICTNFPNYRIGRQTRERIIYIPALFLHESLSRSYDELKMKLDNWGHNNEINPNFLEKWKKVNEHNYKEHRNFFYIEPEKWKELAYVKGTTAQEMEKNLVYENVMPSDFYVWKKNVGQWFKFLFK